MSTSNGNLFEDIINGISEGLVASFSSFITGILLGFINPLLTGIGFDPIEL